MGNFTGSGLKGAQASLGMRLLRSSVKEAEAQKQVCLGIYILMNGNILGGEVSKTCLMNYVWVYV